MTLEEAIKHCEEIAEENEKKARKLNDGTMSTRIKCEKCANEHRQLAEWLRELQKWRALRDNINKLCDVDCEYPQYRESGTMCDACPIGTVKEYFEQIFGEEVNADDKGGAEE